MSTSGPSGPLGYLTWVKTTEITIWCARMLVIVVFVHFFLRLVTLVVAKVRLYVCYSVSTT